MMSTTIVKWKINMLNIYDLVTLPLLERPYPMVASFLANPLY
jgi:hypothetical protein